MSLSNYLKRPENMTPREHLLFHRLLFDLKVEVARTGHSLLASTPEVDRDGYDVALWSDTDISCLQCKSFIRRRPGKWMIHKRILSTRANDFPQFKHEGIAYPHPGFAGGLLVIEALPSDEALDVRYQYADLLSIWSLAHGIVRKKRDVEQAALAFLAEMLRDPLRTAMPSTLLLRPRSNAHLAAVIGLEATVPRFGGVDLRRAWIESDGNAPDRAMISRGRAWLHECYADLV